MNIYNNTAELSKEKRLVQDENQKLLQTEIAKVKEILE